MGNITSTLTMALFYQGRHNAAAFERDTRRIDAAGRRLQGRRGVFGAAPVTTAGALAAGQRLLVMAGGTYALARGARAAVTQFSTLERQMTRIALTADASRDQGQAAIDTVRKIAEETALANQDVVAGLDTLVAAGRTLPDALGFLPAVARTAQAAGARVTDIALSADAVANSLEISSDRMQSAFDIMVAGGKAGKFELKDMAQYLPSLAPMAAAIGLKGEEGLRKLVAMLQVARTQTGTASEAATNLANVFQKMETDRTAKKFKDFGVDLRREMKAARREGKDLMEVFLDLTERALKGDMSKLPQLFTDMQAMKGVRALLMQRDAMRDLQNTLRGVDGSTIRDLNTILEDQQARVDQLKNSWNNFVVSLGNLGAASGTPEALDEIANSLNGIADALAKVSKDGTGAAPDIGKDLLEWFAGDESKNIYENAFRKAAKDAGISDAEMDDAKARAHGALLGRDFRKSILGEDVEASDRRAREAARRDVERELRAREKFDDIRAAGENRMRRETTNDALSAMRAERDQVATELAKARKSPIAVGATGLEMKLNELNRRLGAAEAAEQARARQTVPTTASAADRASGGLPRPKPPVEPGPLPSAKPYRPPSIDPQSAIERFMKRNAPAGGTVDKDVEGIINRLNGMQTDLGPQADATMGSFRDGLRSQMKATESEVDAFVSRLRSKLSFTANPKVNATMTVNKTSAGQVDHALGQDVASGRNGNFSNANLVG